MGSLTWFCCLAAVLGSTVARPSGENIRRNARGQTITDGSDPLELQPQGDIQALAYYGGAKGQFLLIHPSGQRTVSKTPPALKGAPKPDKEEEEEDVGMAPEEEDADNDSVAINPPPDNASVAEAKPVGLAIAGPGGVASASPVGQAIVGPGGLAIAKPVGTAISGVRGGGAPTAVAVEGKNGEETKARRKQVFFDPETNQLHSAPVFGQRYLYPVNLY